MYLHINSKITTAHNQNNHSIVSLVIQFYTDEVQLFKSSWKCETVGYNVHYKMNCDICHHSLASFCLLVFSIFCA